MRLPTLSLLPLVLLLLGSATPSTADNHTDPVETADPTTTPTLSPTSMPTTSPTSAPTSMPVKTPTSDAPTSTPVASPTSSPTSMPVVAPTTTEPTEAPTVPPTPAPTNYKTPAPTPWKGITYRPVAKLHWDAKLDGTGGNSAPAPRKGNAVAVSPDDMFVYVTTDDGKVTILEAQNGNVKGSHTAENKFYEGGIMSSQSGVSFGNRDGKLFAVYGVTESPLAGTGTKCRVVGVSHPSGEELFTSTSFDGTIQGTPMVGADGKYIYVVRNDDAEVGHFTLLEISAAVDSASEVFSESSGKYDVNETGTYAPLNLGLNPDYGNYKNGNRNFNDIAVWGHLYKGGTSVSGQMKVFQLPAEAGWTADSLATITIDAVAWSTYSKPTLSANGIDLFFTITQAEMRGWRGGQRWGRKPWRSQLEVNQGNGLGRLPPLAPAALSSDNLRLYVPSATNSFHAVNAVNGSVVWTQSTEREIETEPRLSPDDMRVYSIQEFNGMVTAHDTQDGGKALWSKDCTLYTPTTGPDANPFCKYSVSAEFSLSSTGYYMYYADVRGTVVALELGYATPPTVPPTYSPTSAPTPAPSGSPTLAPLPTATPTAMPTPEAPWTRPPTSTPTASPTGTPTSSPTGTPTAAPTGTPTVSPTQAPIVGTRAPTTSPTSVPTVTPTSAPTGSPTMEPTMEPTKPFFETRDESASNIVSSCSVMVLGLAMAMGYLLVL